MQLYEESIKDALQAIKLFKYIKQKDNNYYTTIVSAYYNCASGYQNLLKYPQFNKYLLRAQKIAMIYLGSSHSLTIYISKQIKYSEQRRNEANKEIQVIRNITGYQLSPIQNRSKINIKYDNKHKFYKKFKKTSESVQFDNHFHENQLSLSYKMPLYCLKEEDERGITRYKDERFDAAKAKYSNIDTSKELSQMLDSINTSPINNDYKTTKFINPINKIKSFSKRNLKKRKETKKKIAIIKIQAYFRRYLAMKKYKKIKNAIIIIQKNIKKFQVKKMYSNIRSAIIFIQVMYREYNQKKIIF